MSLLRRTQRASPAVIDDSISGSTGLTWSISGNATDANGVTVQSVLFDQSPTINAERIEIDITGSVSANIADSDATIEFWCRPTSSNSEDDPDVFNGNIMFDGDNFAGNGGAFIISVNGGVLNIGVNPESSGTGQPSGYVDFRGTTTINDDAWHHIVMTWDLSTGDLQGYVDGSREINQTVNTQGTGNIHWLSGGGAQDQLLVLGREKGGFNTAACFYGRLSEVRISPSVLYSGATITVPTSPLDGSGTGVAYYDFDEGSGSTVADTGGGTNSDGTITGAVWDTDGPYFSQVTTLTLTNTQGAARNNRVEMFGHAFARGDIPSGDRPQARINGSSIPTQVERSSTWPDGSLQYAVLAVNAGDFTASESKAITITDGGSAPSGSNIAIADLPADGSSNADLTLGAETITVNRTNLTTPTGTLTQVFSGPHCAHWVYRETYPSAARVYARFDIYAFREATTGTVDRVEYAGGNEVTQIRRDEADHGTVASSLNRFRVDGSNVLSETDVLYQYSRWWEHDFDLDIHCIHNRDYLASTGVVWDYLSSFTVNATAISQYDTAYTSNSGINDTGGWRADMSAGGTDPDIGPIPGQDACYLISQDSGLRDTVLRMHQRWGRHQVHFWDEDEGRPVQVGPNAGQHANSGLNPDLGFSAYWGSFGSASWTTAGTDVAHQPRCGFVPYLLTGRDWYLEEMQFWASTCCGNGDGGYINATNYNILSTDQVRAEGWGLCTVAVAAALSPDSTSMKTFFEGALARNVAFTWDNNYAPGQAGHVLTGAVGPQYPSQRSDLLLQDGFLISWQVDFVTLGAVWAWKLGYDGSAGSAADFSDYSEYLSRWVTGRMNKFGWQSSPLYWISLAGTTLPASWDEMRVELYAENQSTDEAFRPSGLIPFDDTTELQEGEPGSLAWRQAFNSDLGAAETVGFSTEPASDILITWAAISAAVERGVPGASEARTDYITLSNKPNTETGGVQTQQGQPQFEIVPNSGFPHQTEPLNDWIQTNITTGSTFTNATASIGNNLAIQDQAVSYSGGGCGGGYVFVTGGGHNNGMNDATAIMNLRKFDTEGFVEVVRSTADQQGVADTAYSTIGTYLNGIYDTAIARGGYRDERGLVPYSRHTYDGIDVTDDGTIYMYGGTGSYDNTGQPAPSWNQTGHEGDLWRYRQGIGWDQPGERGAVIGIPTAGLCYDRVTNDRVWTIDDDDLRYFTLSTGTFSAVVQDRFNVNFSDESWICFDEDSGAQGRICAGGSFGGSTFAIYDIATDTVLSTNNAIPGSTTSTIVFHVPASRGSNYGTLFAYAPSNGTLHRWNGSSWSQIASGGPAPNDFMYGRAGFDEVHQIFYAITYNGGWQTWFCRPYAYE